MVIILKFKVCEQSMITTVTAITVISALLLVFSILFKRRISAVNKVKNSISK